MVAMNSAGKRFSLFSVKERKGQGHKRSLSNTYQGFHCLTSVSCKSSVYEVIEIPSGRGGSFEIWKLKNSTEKIYEDIVVGQI